MGSYGKTAFAWLFFLLLVSCGDSGGPGANVRGTWFGTFIDEYGNEEGIIIFINCQTDGILDGTWQDGATGGDVFGYLVDGTIRFELDSVEKKTCCGLLGCITSADTQYFIYGTLDLSTDPISVTDNDASHGIGCIYREYGEITMTLDWPTVN